MRNKLFWPIAALGLIAAAMPATADDRPAYCSGAGTERLPECGWTGGKERAPAKPAHDSCTSSEQQVRDAWVKARVYRQTEAGQMEYAKEYVQALENLCRWQRDIKPTPLPPELQQLVR